MWSMHGRVRRVAGSVSRAIRAHQHCRGGKEALRRRARKRQEAMTTIAGKTIYITGGSSGMGLAAGQQLAGRGAHLVLLDLNPSDAAMQAIEAARRSPQQRVSRYQLNVADREGVLATVGQ